MNFHVNQAFVDEATFNTFWQGISNTLVGKGVGAIYWDAINRLKTESMDPFFQALVKEWKRDDDSVKDKRQKHRKEPY